ncbi:hypothetical protein PAPYR_986 [Paratrimastix pyriformis]|uniref:Uncharacterized protein n=1 Tax=Paratrimastix pyriformis TaxID=342808 RepID=A0ABQ8UVE7_9EUKA|nr:hypothetical protein PAPYR_986 [Paratrimastix pyriformis]
MTTNGTGFRKVEPAILDGRLARKRIDALSLFKGWESLITFHRTLALDHQVIRILSIRSHIQTFEYPHFTTATRHRSLTNHTKLLVHRTALAHSPTRAQGPPTLVAHHPVLTVQETSP